MSAAEFDTLHRVCLAALEVGIVVLVVGLLSLRARTAGVRRALWQASLLATVLLIGVEATGWRRRGDPVSGPRRVLAVGFAEAEPLTGPVPEGSIGAGPAVVRTANGTRGLRLFPLLAMVWAVGTGFLLLRFLGARVLLGWRVGRRGVGLAVADAGFEEVRGRLGMRPVRLICWPGLRGPVAFGVMRPTVAIPSDLAERFSPDQCRAMFAHELAHLSGRDPVWFLLADLVCALGWWHPGLWWARRRLKVDSEWRADEAAALVPGGRIALAESLAALGRELSMPGGLGVGGSGLRSELAARVVRLVAPAAPPPMTRAGWVAVFGPAAALLLALLPLGPGGRAPSVSAAEPPAKPTDTPAGSEPIVLLEVKWVELQDHAGSTGWLDWIFGDRAGETHVVQEDDRGLKTDRLETTNQWRALDEGQFKALLTRLETEVGNADVLSAPKLTTRAGRQAQISVVEPRKVAVGPDEQPATGTNSAAVVYGTVEVPVGTRVDLLPRFESGRHRLRVVGTYTEFLGYEKADKPRPMGLVRDPGTGVPVKGVPALPRVRVRSAVADAECLPGETIVVRGPVGARVVQFRDKVPVLGSLPLAGRLFRREGTQTNLTRVYLFITPRVTDATGR